MILFLFDVRHVVLTKNKCSVLSFYSSIRTGGRAGFYGAGIYSTFGLDKWHFSVLISNEKKTNFQKCNIMGNLNWIYMTWGICQHVPFSVLKSIC